MIKFITKHNCLEKDHSAIYTIAQDTFLTSWPMARGDGRGGGVDKIRCEPAKDLFNVQDVILTSH